MYQYIAKSVAKYEWQNKLRHYARDPKFQAAYNAWQLDALTGARTRILAMGDAAVTTVGAAVKTDARIALTVLKSLGMLDRPTPGSTDPEEIEQLQKLEKKRAEEKLAEEMLLHSLGGLGRKP